MVALIIWMLAAPEFWAKVLDHMYGKGELENLYFDSLI